MFPDKIVDVRIERTDKDVKNDLGELAQHKSEIDLDDFKFSYVLKNYGNNSFKELIDEFINVELGVK